MDSSLRQRRGAKNRWQPYGENGSLGPSPALGGESAIGDYQPYPGPGPTFPFCTHGVLVGIFIDRSSAMNRGSSLMES